MSLVLCETENAYIRSYSVLFVQENVRFFGHTNSGACGNTESDFAVSPQWMCCGKSLEFGGLKGINDWDSILKQKNLCTNGGLLANLTSACQKRNLKNPGKKDWWIKTRKRRFGFDKSSSELAFLILDVLMFDHSVVKSFGFPCLTCLLQKSWAGGTHEKAAVFQHSDLCRIFYFLSVIEDKDWIGVL